MTTICVYIILHSAASAANYNLKLIILFALTSRVVRHPIRKKAGLQTFLHLKAPSRPNGQWHLASGHNGVHCCGTVGDSHSHSQLIAAKRTFAGNTFLYCVAKVRIIFEYNYNWAEKSFIVFFDSTFRNNQ